MTGGTVGYAFVLGMIALLNPCGFPLLPVYLASFVDGGRGGWAARAVAGVRAGVAITTGFVAVFAGAGLLAGSARAVILAVAPWVMVVVAAAIVVVGILTLSGKTLSLHALPRFRSGRGFGAMAGFGCAYAVGSLSCSLPVFVVAAGGALASGSALTLVAVILAYALGMGLFATVLSVAIACADGAAFRSLRPVAAVLPRIAGGVCIVVGVYLAGYWIGQIGGPDLVAPVTSALDTTQAYLASVIENAWLPIGAVFVAIVLAVLIAVALRSGTGAVSEPTRGEDS